MAASQRRHAKTEKEAARQAPRAKRALPEPGLDAMARQVVQRARANPRLVAPGQVALVQRAFGNRAITSLLPRSPARLTRYGQGGARVADQVTRASPAEGRVLTSRADRHRKGDHIPHSLVKGWPRHLDQVSHGTLRAKGVIQTLAEKVKRYDAERPPYPAIAARVHTGGTMGAGKGRHASLYLRRKVGEQAYDDRWIDLGVKNGKIYVNVVPMKRESSWPPPNVSTTWRLDEGSANAAYNKALEIQGKIEQGEEYAKWEEQWKQVQEEGKRLEEEGKKEGIDAKAWAKEVEKWVKEADRLEKEGLEWGTKQPKRYKYAYWFPTLSQKWENCSSFAEKVLKAAGVQASASYFFFFKSPAMLAKGKMSVRETDKIKVPPDVIAEAAIKAMIANPDLELEAITNNLRATYPYWNVNTKKVRAELKKRAATGEKTKPRPEDLKTSVHALIKTHPKWSANKIHKTLTEKLLWVVTMEDIFHERLDLYLKNLKEIESLIKAFPTKPDNWIAKRAMLRTKTEITLPMVGTVRKRVKAETKLTKPEDKRLKYVATNVKEKRNISSMDELAKILREERKWDVTKEDLVRLGIQNL